MFKSIKNYLALRRIRKKLKNKSPEEVMKIMTELGIKMIIEDYANEIIEKELRKSEQLKYYKEKLTRENNDK